jgi:predicted ribosomally synthesized peptide with SipW-like signal peptide
MKTKLYLVVLAVLLAAALAGGATMAIFTDAEANTGNTFTAGTLTMRVGDGGAVMRIDVPNMAPGDVTPYYRWVIRNTGSLPGRLSVTFSPIINNENGIVEPEAAAEGQFPAHATAGELGQYLTTGVHPANMNPEVLPYVTFIERNDEAGWYIAEVSREVDTRGTFGWGPSGWSVPSRLHGQWQAGPPHPWGVPGLNSWGGRTFGTLGHLQGDILNPGQEVAFFFRAALARDVMRWDGTGWRAVDDNLLQSDSAHFDLTFDLVQVTP